MNVLEVDIHLVSFYCVVVLEKRDEWVMMGGHGDHLSSLWTTNGLRVCGRQVNTASITNLGVKSRSSET